MMRNLIILFTAVLFVQCQLTTSSDGDQIYYAVDKDPQYIGGENSRALFIQENFEYPFEAMLNDEEGTVWVEFVVWKTGEVKNVKVVKGVSESLDREAERVITKMPDWIPGEKDGKLVNVLFTIPIKAELE